MQLAPLRYTKIEGTAVAVTVTSAAEAKAALKELRHKQRELKFLRGALLRRLWRGLRWAVGALFEVATVPRAERHARDPAEIARELQRIDETLHNIEGCILQLQGKLLTLG